MEISTHTLNVSNCFLVVLLTLSLPLPSTGDRCGYGQGWQGPLCAVGYVGREDGVFPGDAEQPRRGEWH